MKGGDLVNKKYFLVPAVALALGAGAIFATHNQASAHGMALGMGRDDNSIVQRLAAALGKSEAEVQAAFDQIHQEKMAEHEAAMAAKLDEAVANGLLTAEQKQLLLDRHQAEKAEREANRETWKSLSAEERRAQMQAHREETRAWAQENGIDLSVLNLGRDGMPGKRHHFDRGDR